MTHRTASTPSHPAPSARSLREPVRWATAVTVIGAVAGLALMFEGTDEDAAIWAIIVFGLIGGAIAALPMTTVRFGAGGDPRAGGDDFPEIWEGYGRAFIDFVRAALIWLAGATGVSTVAFFVDGGRDPSAFLVPLFIGLLWVGGFGIAWLAVTLVWIPVSIVRESIRRRRAGDPPNVWWTYVAVYLLVTLAAAAALLAAFILVPETLDGGRGFIGSFIGLFRVDAATLEPKSATAVWVARGLLAVMVAGMIVTMELARRRLVDISRRA
ncbi:hypothetical protein H9651_13750 [Microbacterium sp. Sa4CUA7]|uniref:Uncharacterized protein n=1 Tax=Microbacterium pullorum TaxID=2762236 RepID=A0ABR8S5F2_9MICO|nr:hypothetical protein [Microbacterium pullorum]MBD7958704.1 hypothetical protein [Microbacterium pullorum]